MKPWIDVQPSAVFATQKERIGERDVDVSVSPYNVPRAIRAEKSPDGNKFLIFFRYLDGEELSGREVAEPDAAVRYGKNSDRVTSIIIDINDEPGRSTAIISAIDKADKTLNLLRTQASSLPVRLNYQAALEALQLSRGQLACLR